MAKFCERINRLELENCLTSTAASWMVVSGAASFSSSATNSVMLASDLVAEFEISEAFEARSPQRLLRFYRERLVDETTETAEISCSFGFTGSLISSFKLISLTGALTILAGSGEKTLSSALKISMRPFRCSGDLLPLGSEDCF